MADPAQRQTPFAVRVRAASLAPGAQQVLPFQGTYHGSNPMPAQFSVGDTQCDPIVVGAAARPVAGGSPATTGDKAKGAPPTPPGKDKKKKKPKDN